MFGEIGGNENRAVQKSGVGLILYGVRRVLCCDNFRLATLSRLGWSISVVRN